MNREYKVVALDLDGTLTNSQKVISPKTKEVLNKAMEKGVIIVLASGRPEMGIVPLAKELNLTEGNGFIIAYNGGKMIECKTQKTIYSNQIPEVLKKDIYEYSKALEITLLTYNENGVITEDSENPYVKKEAFNNSIEIEKTNNLLAYVTYPVEKFMLVGEPEKVKDVLPKFQEKFKGKLNIFCSEPYFIEIMPLGVEKSFAMKSLLEYLNLEVEQLMACGDGMNDIPMIEFAGFGVAMENACADVKQIANYITESNDCDGVANAFEKFVL